MKGFKGRGKIQQWSSGLSPGTRGINLCSKTVSHNHKAVGPL